MLIIIIVIIAVLVMIASFASDSNDSGPTQEDLDRWDEERRTIKRHERHHW